MTSSRPKLFLALALFVALVPAALVPIHSYDFFWHLATGRWIAEHHALPRTDPFAIASDKTEWINGEWLFDVALYSAGTIMTIAWLHAISVAALFAFLFFFNAKRSEWPIALLLTTLAFAGSFIRLDARPSTAAAALLALGIALLGQEESVAVGALADKPGASPWLDDWRAGRPPGARRARHHTETRRADAWFVVLTILWINVHPSALLAPIVALIFRRVHWLPVASAVALLANPFGWKAVVAPLRLTAFARSGAFVNTEWLPSPILVFPLLYLSIAFGIAAFAVTRKELARFVLFALLAYFAIAHVRNQGLFFAALPLLIAPVVPPRWSPRALAFIAVLPIAWTFAITRHAAGVDSRSYPIAAVEQLKRANISGNIYNADQFGGYLIWSFYPERRVLTDGRNELYRAFIPECANARKDSRAWRALLKKYDIKAAVEEYRPPLDVIDVKTGKHQTMDASLAYWPRDEWTLIAKDRVAMVFVRKR